MSGTREIDFAVIGAIARGDEVDANALLFGLRRYRIKESEELRDGLSVALSRALTTYGGAPTLQARASWLRLFVEATAVSNDERLVQAVRDLFARVRREGMAATCVAEVAVSLEARLDAHEMPEGREHLQETIDELERLVARAYRPGAGIAHALDEAPRQIGDGSDHTRTASALLSAYEITGRLPYSMLAEELMRCVSLGDLSNAEGSCSPLLALEPQGLFNSEVARVLCRLATLHEDPEYRKAAVIAPGADYRADAGLLLEADAERARALGAGAAIYALALAELESWRSYAD